MNNKKINRLLISNLEKLRNILSNESNNDLNESDWANLSEKQKKSIIKEIVESNGDQYSEDSFISNYELVDFLIKKIKESEEKKYVIINWNSNWADEMDINGYVIVSKQESEEFKQKLKSIKSEIIICVGTNEDIEYENGLELLDELSFDLIKEGEKNIIEKYTSSGHNIFYDSVLQHYEDNVY